jgi:CRP/FNR family cyclic AMP-dependent transcriptional regulator
MSELDFTRPAQSEVYDAAVARQFFADHGQSRQAAAGDLLFSEGAAGTSMFYLVSGDSALTRGSKSLDVLKAGEVLGEMSVLTRESRSATAAMRTAGEIIEMEGAAVSVAIQKMPEFALLLLAILIKRLRLALAMQMLSRTQPAGDVPVAGEVFDADLLRDLTSNFPGRPPVYKPKNNVIMRQGDAGIFMYVVLKGQVVISVKDKPVEVVAQGGVFGEMALVDQAERAASATAITDCDLLSINRTDFLQLIKTKPEFGIALLRALAARLRTTGRK